LSTDFMADIVERGGNKYLNPVLMDVNFFFGYSGLKDFNIDAYATVALAKDILLEKGMQFFNIAGLA
ncbi:hypothetical protein KY321_01380, partial [Candidatus Woesearchaeota archaeon]|nr:hypothetical protein [Candidatus Woesearchaeota archaeon]